MRFISHGRCNTECSAEPKGATGELGFNEPSSAKPSLEDGADDRSRKHIGLHKSTTSLH
jgi:hypothetical protein